MDLKLEAIIVPVSDVDRAKKFYAEALEFRVDIDHHAEQYEKAVGFRHRGAPSYRIVQLTPPGSECSIQIGTGITRAVSGSLEGLYLITSDIEATRAELVRSGVDVSEPFHFGPNGQTPGVLTRDDILDNITLYWFTKTAVSSARLCWESHLAFFAPKGLTIPVAVSAFPEELYQAPRSWTEKGVSQTHLLQQARQRRTLRSMGAARAVGG